MTLVDTGPLVALLYRKDPKHQRCLEAMSRQQRPLLTTWPAFTDAMFLLRRGGGWLAQDRLWTLAHRGDLVLAELAASVKERSADLMRRYADLPMALADATLVALAEESGLRRIVTLDGDFYVYRLVNGRALEVVP